MNEVFIERRQRIRDRKNHASKLRERSELYAREQAKTDDFFCRLAPRIH